VSSADLRATQKGLEEDNTKFGQGLIVAEMVPEGEWFHLWMVFGEVVLSCLAILSSQLHFLPTNRTGGVGMCHAHSWSTILADGG